MPDVEYFNISYDAGIGKNNTANTVTQIMGGESITLADAIAPNHYVFVGWYTTSDFQENSKVDGAYTVNENVTFYAKYEQIPPLTITYMLDGGENAPTNPTSYYAGEGTGELAPATKDRYTFEGWFLDAEFETQVISILTTMDEDITLYAKFSKDPVFANSTYVLNGGENSPNNPVKYTQGQSLLLCDAVKA